MPNKKYFITTAIDYLNSPPHIGHAYEKIAADILARYYRKNNDVYFLTGSDEHGAKVAEAAEKAGKEPKVWADEMVEKYKDAWKALNISYDRFIRTTDPDHEKFVREFVQKLYEKKEIYQGKYEGLYCIGCEEYKVHEELGDENVCPIHDKKCEIVHEDVYFFRLSKYQKELVSIIESNKIIIQPDERRNEILKFLKKEPLKDLAITRSKVEWGIKCPWDEKQTLYVWVDALLNYISGADGNWPADLHLIGKDVFRFHTIIWPAMLLAADYELPKKLFIHGFLTVDGKKISKTLGNVINPIEISREYSTDVLRYFLMREIPFGQDGDFNIARLSQRYNSDLANDLGNLLQRTLVLAGKNPNVNFQISNQIQSSNVTLDIEKEMEGLDFGGVLTKIWKDIKKANQYIDKERPWEKKEEPDELAKILEYPLEVLAQTAEAIEPFMPETAEKIKGQLESRKPEVLFPKK